MRPSALLALAALAGCHGSSVVSLEVRGGARMTVAQLTVTARQGRTSSPIVFTPTSPASLPQTLALRFDDSIHTWRQGRSWMPIATTPPSVRQLLALPGAGADTVYALSASDGVFVETGGRPYAAFNDGLGVASTSLTSLAIDPVCTNVLYAGAQNGNVYSTTSGR
jgi:hypothetical protein